MNNEECKILQNAGGVYVVVYFLGVHTVTHSTHANTFSIYAIPHSIHINTMNKYQSLLSWPTLASLNGVQWIISLPLTSAWLILDGNVEATPGKDQPLSPAQCFCKLCLHDPIRNKLRNCMLWQWCKSSDGLPIANVTGAILVVECPLEHAISVFLAHAALHVWRKCLGLLPCKRGTNKYILIHAHCRTWKMCVPSLYLAWVASPWPRMIWHCSLI